MERASIVQLRSILDFHKKHAIEAQVRYIPEEVVVAAQEGFSSEMSSLQIIDYILGAFYIYRGSVNIDPFRGVPHQRVGDSYQWLQLADLNWGDLTQITNLGRLVHRPTRVPMAFRVTEGLVVEGGTEREMTELERATLDLENRIAYLKPESGSLGFVDNPVEWQGVLLRAYANPLSYLKDGLQEQKIDEVGARGYLSEHLDNLRHARFSAAVWELD